MRTLISAFILILFFTGYSLAKDKAMALAEWLFEEGYYEEAITEYKRYIFFNPKGEFTSYAYYKIGLSYRAKRKWSEALDALRKSIHTAQNDKIKDERRMELVVVLIASKNYSAAEFVLLQVEFFSKLPELRERAAFFRGISCLYSFKWKEAREAFRKYFSGKDSELSQIGKEIDSLLLKAQKLKYKSPRLAKILSTILPGAGQVYVGEWGDGLNAIIINTATGYLLGSALLGGCYGDVITAHLPLFMRYYLGNRENAYRLAKHYNKRLNQTYAKKLLGKLSLLKCVYRYFAF